MVANWREAVIAAPPGEPQRFELGAVSIDVRDRAHRLAGRALLASLATAVPLAFVVGAVLVFIPLAAALTWVITMLLPRLRSVGPGPGAIEVRGDALTVIVDVPRRARVERCFTVAELARGYRTDDEVRLETRKGETIALGIDSAATGEALLRALRLDARRRVLEVPLASIASRVPGAVTLAWIVAVLQGPSILLVPLLLVLGLTGPRDMTGVVVLLVPSLIALLLVAAAFCVLRRRRAAIGMDGIVFRRVLRERFYPYGAIANVALAPRGVTLALRSGTRVRLRTRGFWSMAEADPAALALFERIETARAAATLHDVQAKLPLLERRGRTAEAWRAHLTTLVSTAGYRTGAVTARDLAAVIDDAALSAEHRVAATLALSATEPEEARTRARIAAAACADPHLRAALDHAAEGELDEGQLDRVVACGR